MLGFNERRHAHVGHLDEVGQGELLQLKAVMRYGLHADIPQLQQPASIHGYAVNENT